MSPDTGLMVTVFELRWVVQYIVHYWLIINMKRCTSRYSLLCALLLCAPFTQADELLEIQITSGIRTEQPIKTALTAVTVITRDKIDRLQVKNLHEILRHVEGISFSNNGGAGKATSLFIRGTESDHVLVIIDGIKAGSATLGNFSFQNLTTDQIERIEILRGPRASLYGSEAIGGVIQIFTKKGGGKLTPEFSASTGHDNTHQWSTGISGGGRNGWFNLSLSNMKTDGFNACSGSATLFAGCFTDEPDHDGNHNRSYSLRAGYRFDNHVEIDAYRLRTAADTEFDGTIFGGNESKAVEQITGTSLKWPINDHWDFKITAGQSLSNIDSFFNGVYLSKFDTTRNTFTLQNDIQFSADQQISIGIDQQNDRIKSTTVYAETSRDNTGIFMQYTGSFDQHYIEASLRSDDNEHSGSHDTSAIAWGYPILPDVRLIASYATAFKAPTFNELYFPFFGNPDLDNETSSTRELSLVSRIGNVNWAAHLFQTRIDNLIAYDASTFLAGNIIEARVKGIELALMINRAGWDIHASTTFLDTQNRSPDANYGNKLNRRPAQVFNLEVDRQQGKWTLGGNLHAESHRYDDLSNTNRLNGYATVNIRVSYKITKDWTLSARLDNIFDKNYQTAAFYNQPGRAAYLAASWRPE